MHIEAELRSFLTEGKYLELRSFLDANAKFLSEEEQETVYFHAPEDLRVQKSTGYSKIWMKKGSLHADAREEFEVKIDENAFEDAQKILRRIGFPEKVRWHRIRRTYDWEGITVMLDHTRNYGHIIEMELLVEKNASSAIETLAERFARLGIAPTPKHEFHKAYEEYLEKYGTAQPESTSW